MTVDRRSFLDASGRHELRSPVVYLDQSTLVDAFHGKHHDGVDAAINAELASVVENVASRGTLCLSIVHVVETLPWPNRDDALALARWLDGLSPLWFQTEGAIEDELANEVRRRVGLRTAAAGRLPIHDAMSAAVRESITDLTAAAAADFLSAPDVASLVRKLHRNPRLNSTHESAGAYSVNVARRLYADRASIPDGTPPEQVAGVTWTKFCHGLQYQARQMINMAPVERGESYPSDLDVSKAVIDALDDPNAVPLTKVNYHLMNQVGDGIKRSDPQSGTFEAKFGSFIWDTRHALAAAVVDVFTCDSYVDSVLTDFRESRGMERQISMRGRDRAALVAELRRQCA